MVAAASLLSAPVAGAPKTGVSPQTISLPSGPGSIEGLGESFQPQLNTGTATYSIKFKLPPGRAGAQPQVSARYNGGSGNGVLGIGWSLQGIDYIQRQSDKGLPRYDSTDTFVSADGEELVPLSDGSFREENEGAFRRYHFNAQDNSWTCEERNGVRLTLGGAASSRIVAHICAGDQSTPCVLDGDCGGGQCVEDSSRTYRWYVTRSEDPNGNRIEYAYTQLAGSPGVVYVNTIQYTLHATTTPSGSHILKFTYSARPDAFSDFRSGFEMTTGHRLTRLDICTRGASFTPESMCGDAGPGGVARVRAYGFTYEDVGSCQSSTCTHGLVGAFCEADADCIAGTARLAAITQLGADNQSALPALRFQYTELNPGQASTWEVLQGFPVEAIGDQNAALVDLNGDGLPDVLETAADDPGNYHWWENRGRTQAGLIFQRDPDFAAPTEVLSTPGTQLADLDGDGIVDLITRPSAGSPEFRMYRGTGRGFFDPTWKPFEILGYDDFSTAGFESPDIRLVDLDFDKRIDVMRTVADLTGATDTWVRLNGKDHLDPQASCGPIGGPSGTVDFANGRTFLADMNGDRLLDVVVVSTRSDAVQSIQYFPGVGGGGFGVNGRCGQQGVPVIVGGDAVSDIPTADFLNFRNFFWQDVTNDGLADLIYVGPDRVVVWINVAGSRLKRFDLAFVPEGTHPDAVELADVNGNGTTDIVIADRGMLRTQYLDVVGASGVPANLLRLIDNGLGSRTVIDYKPSTADYIADREGAVPWKTTTPFPDGGGEAHRDRGWRAGSEHLRDRLPLSRRLL